MTREARIRKVREFRQRGLSYVAIAQRMDELFGVKMSPHTIRRYCDYTLARSVA